MFISSIWYKMAGSAVLKDIAPGEGGSSPKELTAIGMSLYFNANGGINGREIWKTDGTTVGTVLVKDVNIGANDSTPANFIEAGGLVFFSADDGINGMELWKTDGTSAGTVLVKDKNSGIGNSNPNTMIAALFTVNIWAAYTPIVMQKSVDDFRTLCDSVTFADTSPFIKRSLSAHTKIC